jgi:hypothetical protein
MAGDWTSFNEKGLRDEPVTQMLAIPLGVMNGQAQRIPQRAVKISGG